MFNDRPKKEWEFMATGTGQTGVTVRFPQDMHIQVNHHASLDEMGMLRPLGIVKIDLGGHPFLNHDSFHMQHHLKTSVIQASAKTIRGDVCVEIRAHRQWDVIRVDIKDQREQPQELSLFVRTGYAARDSLLTDKTYITWHQNPAGIFDSVNAQCGFAMQDDALDPLHDRVFGMAILYRETGPADNYPAFHPFYNTPKPTWSSGYFTAPPATHHTLYLVGISALGGKQTFFDQLSNRLDQLDHDMFISSHEKDWQSFWAKSWFEPDYSSKQIIRYKAAYDLYRYYMACAAGSEREFPVRFMNDLFRYAGGAQHKWSTMVINSVETYQAYYGAMRTLDVDALEQLFTFYNRYFPLFKRFSRARYPVNGTIIPYEHSIWGSFGYWAGEMLPWYTEESPYLKNTWAGNLWMILLMTDYVQLTQNQQFATRVLEPFAAEIIAFFQHYYDKRENNTIVFYPAKAGETWQGVKNPAELICAFRAILPRLIRVGRAYGLNPVQLKNWQTLETQLPDIPLGKLQFDPARPDIAPEIMSGNLLVPASDMSNTSSVNLPWTEGAVYPLNRQHTELFAIWPTRLYLKTPGKRKIALLSYKNRIWQHILTHGWSLDLVHAACLGLSAEVNTWYDRYFNHIFVFPCGLAREAGPRHLENASKSLYPSMQGMGTGVIPVLEMLLQDYPDELRLLPSWPLETAVRFCLYSPYAGQVRVNYQPGRFINVKTDRTLALVLPEKLESRVELIRE